MFKILRDTESGICRPCDVGFPTQGSQVCLSFIYIIFILESNFMPKMKLGNISLA